MPCLDDPCLVFALGREARPFCRLFPGRRRFSDNAKAQRLTGVDGMSVVVLQTGVGEERMRHALDWLVRGPAWQGCTYRPRTIWSAGYSGALREDLQVGDVVVGDEVIDCEGRVWPVSRPHHGALRVASHRGRLLCTPEFIHCPRAKLELGRRHGALAVDMESSAVAEICVRTSLPFGCVRVISDDARTPVSPHFSAVTANGKLHPGKLAWGLCRSPRLLLDLFRLERHTRLASQRLATALLDVLREV
jgi:adenosylhomocysteine nucleosidase